MAAQPIATHTMIDQKMCLKPEARETQFSLIKKRDSTLTCPEAVRLRPLCDVLPAVEAGLVTKGLKDEECNENFEVEMRLYDVVSGDEVPGCFRTLRGREPSMSK